MIEKLKKELLKARSENRQLIDALRSLHSRFNSLQMHADKQSELLLGDGEELRVTKQRLVSVQRALDRKTEECERLQKQLAKISTGRHDGESGRSLSRPDVAERDDKVTAMPVESAGESQAANRQPARPRWYAEEDDSRGRASGGRERPRHTSESKRSTRSVTERFIVLPIGGRQTETHYPLSKDVMTIGRSRDNDITVVSGCVSRVHARIIQKGSRVLIEDTGSKNGIMVNSKPIDRYELKHGDTFTVGKQEFELFDGSAGARAAPAA